MAGGSFQHSVIGGNLIREAGNAIIAEASAGDRLTACNTLTSDLRIAVDGGKRYLYADATIVCGEPVFDDDIPTAITNPTTVFEVVSPSSEGYDRGRKFEFYGALDALREYVIVEQDRRRIEVRHRVDASAPWKYTVLSDGDDTLALPSLGVALPLSGVYRNWKAPKLS